MRYSVKGKGEAPPEAPIAELLEEYPDAALTWWLQQEEHMAEPMPKGEDPESLCTAQRLAAAEEEKLGMEGDTLAIIENELPVA